MTGAASARRVPTQERSRRTVQSILDAAESLVGESGVDAATTRAIAERAGIAAPSLYRFFADRDEVLDAVLARALRDLDAHAEVAERDWAGTTIDEFIRLELELHVAYYEAHPSFLRLWFGGRVSPSVVAEVHSRNRALAARARSALTDAGHVDTRVPDSAFILLVELGDRVLDLAFRDRLQADGEILALGRLALSAYVNSLADGTRLAP